MNAAYGGFEDVIMLLLSQPGVDVNACDNVSRLHVQLIFQ